MTRLHQKPVINIFIIGGFLGSGKTTLLNRILGSPGEDKKIALIINEFGEISLDGMLVEKRHYTMKEIMGGCVCCTLKVQLVEGLIEIIRNEEPDEIYIEATGMAVPWEMKQNIEEGLSGLHRALVKKVMVCVDAKQYRKAAGKLPIYDRQFQGDPEIFLTKQDIYEQTLIDEVRADISRRFGEGHHPPAKTNGIEDHRFSSTGPDENIIQLTFTGTAGPTAGELSSRIEDIREDIIRAKGIITEPGGTKGEVLQYDGTRMEVTAIPGGAVHMNSLIVFCMSGKKDRIVSHLSPLYA